jgi:hypothetical protein
LSNYLNIYSMFLNYSKFVYTFSLVTSLINASWCYKYWCYKITEFLCLKSLIVLGSNYIAFRIERTLKVKFRLIIIHDINWLTQMFYDIQMNTSIITSFEFVTVDQIRFTYFYIVFLLLFWDQIEILAKLIQSSAMN